jgi:arylsulfatase A-like enzyme
VSHRLIALVVLGLGLLASSPSARAARPDRPNVVFILADDQGYTDLGCYGSGYYETPNIDKLASQGVRFTSGYSCGPNCQPTRAALMTGQYGPRTGVYTVGNINRFDWESRPLRPVDNVTQLPLEKVTVAQALHDAGYATGMFGKWHLGNPADHHPSKRGFDEAIVSMGKHFDFVTTPKVDYPQGTYLADFLTDRAIDFIRQHKDGPFFLYLPHFGVHAPYQAKKELIERFKKKAPAGGHHDPTYAAMIYSVDESVGRVLATLDELKLTEDTLVIYSSDNGGVGGYVREGIKPQGQKEATDNAPLRGGKGMLYEGGIRVPYIFRWPGKTRAGTTCDEPINSVDLFPTLLEVTGAKGPAANQVLDGVSYAPLLRGERSTLGRDAIYWHFPGYLGAGPGRWRTTPAGAIRAGNYKLIEFFEDGRRELYDLSKDLGERQDLAARMPEKVKELEAKLADWRKQVGAKMPTPHEPRKGGPKRPRNRGGAEDDE